MTISSHQMAIEVEWRVRQVFECDRFGFGGIANSDFIDYGGCYTAFASTLAKYFPGRYSSQIEIFLDQYSDLSGKKIEEDEARFKEAISDFKILLELING